MCKGGSETDTAHFSVFKISVITRQIGEIEVSFDRPIRGLESFAEVHAVADVGFLNVNGTFDQIPLIIDATDKQTDGRLTLKER